MPLPLDKLCICSISFYRMSNDHQRRVNQSRKLKDQLKEARRMKKVFIIAFVLLLAASVAGKCYIVK